MPSIICQRSGLNFEASSARMKQHPQISAWLQAANKEGWYGFCVEAIAEGKRLSLQTIDDFAELVEAAKSTGISLIHEKETEWKNKLAAIKSAKEERKKTNALLHEHGYSWHSSAVLDEAQGETGDYEWDLFQGDRYVGTGESAVVKAVNEINSRSDNSVQKVQELAQRWEQESGNDSTTLAEIETGLNENKGVQI